MDTPAIVCEGLRKRYRKTTALNGFDLAVPEGAIHGLLGPNGAGKTTAVRALATLLRPDSGRAEVAGFSVIRQPAQVRARIGLAGQNAAVDEILSARQNLVMLGRLYHLPAPVARRRAEELLGQFGLAEAGGKPVRQYSGGMRRRLDLAASFIVAPRVLFLDEPTTGLDPQARRNFWELVESIKAQKKTIILTTHYMDEAELLCDEIVIMDRGRIVAQGAPRRLLREHFAEVLLELPRQEFPQAARSLALKIFDTSDRVEITTDNLEATLRTLLDASVPLTNLRIRPANLEDLFLKLTGSELRP
jgi:ABC-2 type transport system ATP-binding protein